jgi:arylsulfatase A-like enzyme
MKKTFCRDLPATLVIGVIALSVWRPVLAGERPNVLVILTDDQGWGDLSLNGNRNLVTPNVDSLAREGVQFDRFYVCPVCSPTRAEFLTGRYHTRGGVFSTSAGGERLDLDERTIAEVFREAGYATGAFGKWHNGMQYPYHPNGRGFDEFYGFCSGHWGNYFSPPLDHNGRIVQGRGFVVDDFTDHAMAFIESNRDRPFFCYLAYNTPHSPMQVPDRFWGKFDGADLAMRHREPDREDEQHTRAALAMCENIDWNVGRMLALLDQLQLSKTTIVLYFCDNGPNGWRWNGGMRGRKGSTDEGGVRSPLLMRWPGTIPSGRTVPQIAAAIDLLPTLTDLAGIGSPGGSALDGVSLKPLLMDSSAARRWADRHIFSYWNGRASVRSQEYRLDERGRLYNIEEDPGQERDIAREHPAVVSELATAMQGWREAVVPGSLRDDRRPFPVGHPEFRYTQLPARDALFEGNIKRSNRWPNCSYLTQWKALEDRISWDVDVLKGGRFEVELYYACPASDVGAMIELSCGEQRLAGTLSEANDPPVEGMEHDRLTRQESYVKEFRPWRMGVIDLAEGAGVLTLKASAIPGSQALEFRTLMLTRVN